MIRINQPIIYKSEKGYRLESLIQDDSINKEYKIWYEVEASYSKYLCSELADAFLLITIPFAVDRGQAIYVNANISPQLLYNARNCHIPFYAALLGKSSVSLETASAKEIHFDGEAIGTGCSLGIDSLSTIYKHIDEKCIPDFKLTHLTLFNACHLGDLRQDELETDLEEMAKISREFAEELGLDFFTVNSNIVSLMEDSDFVSPQLCPVFTVSCALALQKLFKKYLYSSSYCAEQIRIEIEDASHTEGVYVPLLGNENIQIVLSDTFEKRTEKTAYVIKNPLTKKYLNVCGAAQLTKIKNNVDYYFEDKHHLNCGWCEKCMRTLLTIELIGDISEYKNIFNLEKYYKYRNDYIAKITAKSKHEVYSSEIYDLLQKNNIHIPIIGKVFSNIDVVHNKSLLKIWDLYKKARRSL